MCVPWTTWVLGKVLPLGHDRWVKQMKPQRWIGALAARGAWCTLCGSILRSISGAVLGGAFGGFDGLYDFPDQYHVNDDLTAWLMEDFRGGVSVGGIVGAFIGFLLGVFLFFAASWSIPPGPKRLWERGGVFRSMIFLVPAGQVFGSVLTSLAWFAYRLAWVRGDYGSYEMGMAVNDAIMLGGPLGMLLGGLAGGFVALNRARARRLHEHAATTSP